MKNEVITLPVGRERDRRVALVIATRRGRVRPRGRAWINGSEVGEPDRSFAHLGRSYD